MDLNDNGGRGRNDVEESGQPQPSLNERVEHYARTLGFDAVAFARADEPLTVEYEHYLAFIEQGMQGSMHYLARYADVRERLDTAAILEGATTVICLGKRYARTADDERSDGPLVSGIARYAKGHDYHNHVKALLKRVATFVCTLAPGVRARALCDIEPVLERAWAARSGIGFVGKNGLVITPGQGSYQILGEVVTTLNLVPGTPMRERCGSCTRCLDACPTDAFAAPFVLDPRRCVAYLTIENPGPPDPALALQMGYQFFGCDVCQEVCPYNRTAPPDPASTEPFHPLPWLQTLTLDDICALDEHTFDRLFRGTPLRRPKFAGIVRNAVLAAANLIHRDPAGPRTPEALSALRRAAQHSLADVRALAEQMIQELGITTP